MTREEAIGLIKPIMFLMKNPQGEVWSDAYYALEMAIEALKQSDVAKNATSELVGNSEELKEPCEDCVSRQAVDKLSRDLVHVTRDKADFLCNFWEGLNDLPSVNPQEPKTDGDCISREEAIENIKHAQLNFSVKSEIDFTKYKREVQEIADGILNAQIKALSELPSVKPKTEQEPCEDCISREKAKQFLYERIDRLNDDELYDIFSKIIDDMYNELQPVTPERK